MDLRAQILRDEGSSRTVYQDSLGYWTIGAGFLVDSLVKDAGLRPEEIDFILDNRLRLAREELARAFPWTEQLDEVRRAALINMLYQLGLTRLSGFKKMLASLKEGKWTRARAEALNSLWASQTPRRAKRVAKQLETGEWQ